MTAEITTTVGQLSIYQGKWRNNAANQVAVREPRSEDAPGAGKGDLFIITEVQGQAANLDALEQQLAQAIRDTYYLSRGSITASLRRALQAGSDLLYNYNQQSPAETQVIGGVIVLVTSKKDAFVAQLGPAALFAVLGDHIRRYPAQSPWLDSAIGPDPDEEMAVLGTTLIIEPNLHHLRIGPQDKLVLADSRLAKQIPLRKLVRAVDPGNVKTATKNLADITQSSHCSAIVLEVLEAKSAGIGSLKIGGPKFSAPAQLRNFFQRRRRQPDDEPVAVAQPIMEPALETAEAQTHTSAVFSSTSVMQKPMQWLGAFTPKSAPDIPDDEPIVPQPVPAAAYQQPKEEYRVPETTDEYATTMDSVAPESAYRPEFHSHERSGETSLIKKGLQGIGVGLFMLVALLGNGFKNILNLLLPGSDGGNSSRQAGAQAQRQPPSASTLKLLRNVAIAIPILIVLIVSISYLQKGRIREAEYNEFVTTAQQKFEQAQAVDTTAALGLMTEAETSLIQAEEIKQDQPEIAELRVQMAEHADTIGNVHRLYYLPQLRQYSDAGTNLDSIVIQGLDVYVMDTGNDRIFHHQLDDLGEALLPDEEGSLLMVARGQTVENTTVSDLLAMTWMPTGGNRQTSDLVILNSTGLLEYNPNWGITTSALAAGETLGLPAATDSFFGNFYLLDPQANKLLRYLPANDGYSLPPESYFADDSPVNLNSAVDLSIDGAVYILYQDGRINKYLSGQLAEEFTVTGLDIPFNNPVAIYTAPDEEVQYIYVADAGNQRVVQLNKDGSFVRQFKPLAGEDVTFASLQDIYVDEIGGKMYLLDSNNLYLTNIPTAEELVE